ncbi:MAG: response regulator [Verrucomicrobia bacterium]|nr:response regulator [Verrucomicrobiota bacterium]
MNGVIGFTNLLLGTPLNAEQADFANTIRMSGESLLAIINDILDFSKVEAGRLELKNIQFHLPQVAEEAAALLSAKAQEKKVALAVQVEPNVPRSWMGDPIRIRQVILNLAGNSIKFTDSGHVLIRIFRIPQTEPGNRARIRIAIEDTGVGIPEEKRCLLFQNFQQVDSSTTRKYGGTGLGLAISKLLVELMGGEIGVSSVVGQGSVFWFEFPEPHAVATDGADAICPSEFEGVRALVVDDLDVNRRVLQAQLQAWRVHVETCASATEALASLEAAAERGCPFELLLTDHLMPKQDGVDLAKAVRSNPKSRSMGIIMLSSSGQRPEAEPDSKELFAAILVKPVVREILLRDALVSGIRQHQLLSGKVSTGFETSRLPDRTAGGVSKAVPPVVSSFPAVDRKSNWVGRRVLLVEDNPVNQKLARRLLEKEGFDVTLEPNGRLGWKRAEAETFDLVLMDCQMPEMDGFEATTQIRKAEQAGRLPGNRGRRLPIIALTANAIQGDRERCLDAGMDDYVTKPIAAGALREAIERCLESVAGSKAP